MNSELYGNTYRVPKTIIKKIQTELYKHPDSEGIKRAKNIINSPDITYQQLKRLKNFFDTYNPETTSTEQYDLAGGQEMKDFVEQTLMSERDRTERSERLRPTVLKAGDANLRAQNGQVDLEESEDVGTNDGAIQKNVLVIMFNDEHKILLLKRSSYEHQWQPNKWALIGGGIENGEKPIDAAKREVFEETKIKLDKLVQKFSLERDKNNIEQMFVTKLPSQYSPEDVTLNFEHSDYGWYSPEEIKELDAVPNIMDYISIALSNYE